MKADLNRKAIFSSMSPLVSLDGLEGAGDSSTPPEDFEGRSGYNPEFLEGWNIELPLAMGASASDMLQLRRGGKGVELKYENFSVIMSKARRMPMLTAAIIDGGKSQKVPRLNTWKFDGRLNIEDQWGNALYNSNALDRGHMVRREDPVWGSAEQAKRANYDSFHFTNSCPQMAGVNQKTWLGLENYVLTHARSDKMRVAVFTGPFFEADDMQYRGALIPKAFWKVVAIVTEDGRPSATAYKVDQEKALDELEFVYSRYKTFQISIQQVIDATQINFNQLVEYDGFSEHERVTGKKLVQPILGPESIRI